MYSTTAFVKSWSVLQVCKRVLHAHTPRPGYEKLRWSTKIEGPALVSTEAVWSLVSTDMGAGAALGAGCGWGCSACCAFRAAMRAKGPSLGSSDTMATFSPPPFGCVVDTGTGMVNPC